MNDKLKQFLAEWLAWAEADAPEHPVFTARFGLCYNLAQWSGLDYELAFELAEIFNGDSYPFGEYKYNLDCMNNTQHRNPARLAWVRKQLGAV